MNTPPTQKIRVTVPVSPEVLDRFKRLSQVAGQSVGRAMGEWLEETQTGLDPMIEILEKHKKAPLKAIQTLQAYAGTMHDMTQDLFEKVQEMPTDGTDRAPARRSIQAATQDLQKAMKRGLTPPSSNTGGKGTKTAKSGGRGTK